MNLVFKIIFSFILSFLIQSEAIAQQGGWQKLEWGMSPKEVIEEYPSTIKQDTSEYQDPFGAMKTSHLKLESYQLVENDFFASFIFNKDNELVGVMLGIDEDESIYYLYERVLEGLIIKYGKPFKSEEKGSVSITSHWKTGNTLIKAAYISLPIVNSFNIRLGYWMAESEQIDRF